jgi:geranylgeranyl pyrophosphate synthase
MLSEVSLPSYLQRVHERIDEAIESAGFDADQQRMLRSTLVKPRAVGQANPHGDPLSLTFLVARAYGRRMDRQAEHIGAFALLYVLSLDLFDDVQDEDLEGKPHASAPPAIAINDAIALLFLALDELRRGIELEKSVERRAAYLALFSTVSLRAVAGQHRDLAGSVRATSSDEVLAMHEAKTSSVCLLVECGALLGRADRAARATLHVLGERFAGFIQVRDDLRDIFGKPLSPDLVAQKHTYPLACLLESGSPDDREALTTLLAELPGSMDALRSLFYRSGAVEKTAEKLEELRSSIHDAVAATGRDGAPLRTLLDIVDGLAAAVYEPPPVEATTHLYAPTKGFHGKVRREQERFVERMSAYGEAPRPKLRPWRHPHWMYEPETQTIHYPDLEDLRLEVVPFQAALLGMDDLEEVASIMERQLPLVLAHEMFHAWRHSAGRLSDDHWHEEWAANQLSVAYGARHTRSALRSAISLADRVLERNRDHWPTSAEGVLSRCRTQGETRGYGLDMLGIAFVTLEMVRRIANECPELGSSSERWLGLGAPSALRITA